MRKARRMFRIELHRNAPNTGSELYTGIETNAGEPTLPAHVYCLEFGKTFSPSPAYLPNFGPLKAPLSPRRGFLFEDAARQ